jgi:hypothetical protein
MQKPRRADAGSALRRFVPVPACGVQTRIRQYCAQRLRSNFAAAGREASEAQQRGGDWPMGQPHLHRHNGKLSRTRRDIEETNADGADVGALMKENAELRRLVIQLSKLVIKNAMLHR